MDVDREQLERKMNILVMESTANFIEGKVRMFDTPLLGFAQAADPIFEEMKKEQIAGEIFRSPVQWLPEAQSVISYFLPFTREIRSSNLRGGTASIEWLHGRFMGEEFNNEMRKMLVKEMEASGFKAVAPLLEADMEVDFDSYRSSWSERHVAYAAGLGTFSHNRGLITKRGMAGRFGSVITSAIFSPSPREFNTPFDYCPWMRDGSCGNCIERCPSGAITEKGKDKGVCYQHLFVQDPLRGEREKYGYPYSACGKCQTAVPCEDKIPDL